MSASANQTIKQAWLDKFPNLKQLTGPIGTEVINSIKEVTIPAGTTIIRQGDVCNDYLLVVEGSVKVFARAENGREIVLYRIKGGGSCILTTSCLMSQTLFPAEGLTETDTTALTIPARIFGRALEELPEFRQFVLEAYGKRVKDLIVLVEQVAFGRVDMRLARYLLENAEDSALNATHQSVASELGTAREVVSRQLKEFEQRGWVALKRGSIELLDRPKLEIFVKNSIM